MAIARGSGTPSTVSGGGQVVTHPVAPPAHVVSHVRPPIEDIVAAPPQIVDLTGNGIISAEAFGADQLNQAIHVLDRFFEETFDALADGTAITSSNSAFSNPAVTGTSTLTASTTQSMRGGVSAKCVSAASGDNAILEHRFTDTATSYWRFYFYYPGSAPTSNFVFAKLIDRANSALACTVSVTTTGTLKFQDQGSILVGSASAALATGWHRIEVASDGGTITVKGFLGSNVDGTVEDWTATKSGQTNTNIGRAAIGIVSSAGGAYTLYVDQVAADSSWVGGSAAPSLFGAPKVNQHVYSTGISTTEAFGTDKVNLKVYPAGVASVGAIGSPQLNQKVYATGIASAGAFGVVQLNQKIYATGIASAGAFGTARVNQKVYASGIATAETLGSVRVGERVSATGIASAESFGAARVNQKVYATGIASAGSLGADTVRARNTLSPTGMPSLEAAGTPRLNQHVYATAIASAGAVGTPTVHAGAVTITPTGIASATAVGTPTVSPGAVSVHPTAIGTAGTFGTVTVTPGAVTFAPTGITSAAVLGAVVVTARATVAPTGINSSATVDATTVTSRATIVPTAMATAEAFGSPVAEPGAAIIAPAGINPAEAFGLPATVETVLPGAVPSSEALGISTVTSRASIEPVGITPAGYGATSGGYGGAYGYGVGSMGRPTVTSSYTVIVEPCASVAGTPIAPFTAMYVGETLEAAGVRFHVEGLTQEPISVGADVWFEPEGGTAFALTEATFDPFQQPYVPDSWVYDATAGTLDVYFAPGRTDIWPPAYLATRIVSASGLYSAISPSTTVAFKYVDGSYGVVASPLWLAIDDGYGVDGYGVGGYGEGLEPLLRPMVVAPSISVGSPTITSVVHADAIGNGQVGYGDGGYGEGGYGGLDTWMGTPSVAIVSPFTHPTGIPSAAVVGTVAITAHDQIHTTGIASTGAVGSPQLNQAIAVTGIASSEHVDNATLTQRVHVSPISTAELVGSPTVASHAVIVAQAIGPAGVLGATTVQPGAVTITPPSITSAELVDGVHVAALVSPASLGTQASVGAVTVHAVAHISLVGIAGAEVVDTVTAHSHAVIVTTSIPTAGAVGSPTVAPGRVTVRPTGIATGATVGATSLHPGPVFIDPSGITTGEVDGTPTTKARNRISPTGISSPGAVGTPTVSSHAFIRPTGILTREGPGSTRLQPGPVEFQFTGLPSAEVVSLPTLYAIIRLLVGGISSGALVDDIQVLTGPVSIFPPGTGSSETFGSLITWFPQRAAVVYLTLIGLIRNAIWVERNSIEVHEIPLTVDVVSKPVIRVGGSDP